MNAELTASTRDEPNESTRKMEANLKRLTLKKDQISLWWASFSLGLATNIQSYRALRYPLWHTVLWVGSAAWIVASAVKIVSSWLQYKKTARELALLNDVNLIGPLLDAIYEDQPSSYQGLMTPLINLLNQVQASHAPLFNVYHRQKLYTMLVLGTRRYARYHDKEIVLAILKALEQVGDKTAIAPVARICKKTNNAVVRDAAEQCLVFLRQRAEEQSVSDTLLRASNANTAAPETLLRATVAAPDEQPATLLRANAAPNERKT